MAPRRPIMMQSIVLCRLGRVVRGCFLRYRFTSNGEISGLNGKKLWNFLFFRKMPHFHSISLFCLTLKSLLKNVQKWKIVKNGVKTPLYVKYHTIFGIRTKKILPNDMLHYKTLIFESCGDNLRF